MRETERARRFARETSWVGVLIGLLTLTPGVPGCKSRSDAEARASGDVKTNDEGKPAEGIAAGNPSEEPETPRRTPKVRPPRLRGAAPGGPCGAAIRRTQADGETTRARSPERGWSTVLGCASSEWRGWTLDEKQTEQARASSGKAELCCYVTPAPVEKRTGIRSAAPR